MNKCSTIYLFLHILQCWSKCDLQNGQHWSLPMVPYWSSVIYYYYYCIVFVIIKHNGKVNEIHWEAFVSPYHFIKMNICVKCLECGYGMYNVDLLSWKLEFINTFYNYIIPGYCCDNYKHVIKRTSDDMVSILEDYMYKKTKKLY